MRMVEGNYKDESVIEDLGREVLNNMDENTVVVCIGTDRAIGDCIAPLVGTMLKEHNFRFPVYGTIDDPIHALNIERKLNEIKVKHPNANIIGIDACLGDYENIGEIHYRNLPVRAGKGVGKSLPSVGNTSIIGIVDSADSNELFTNRNIRLSFVMGISKSIARGLIKAEREYYIRNKEIAVCNL